MNLKTTAFFTIVAFLLSCQKDDSVLDYINIEQDVELILSQNVNEFGPYAEVIVSTVDSVNCKNAELVIEQKGVNEKTEVFINGLVNFSNCEAGKAKPVSYVKLGFNQNNHAIVFVLKSTVASEGFIEYNNETIELNLELPKGIVVKNNTVQKLQDNTVWGTLTNSNSSVTKEFDALIMGHKQSNFSPQIGNYGVLKFYNDSTIDINDEDILNAKSASKKFFFQYQNWDEFIAELRAFKEKHPEVTLSLRNFKAKSLQL